MKDSYYTLANYNFLVGSSLCGYSFHMFYSILVPKSRHFDRDLEQTLGNWLIENNEISERTSMDSFDSAKTGCPKIQDIRSLCLQSPPNI